MVIMQYVDIGIWGSTLCQQKCDKVHQSAKYSDTVQQSTPDCKIVWCSTELVWKVQEAIDNDYWLANITQVCCIERFFCIWLGFAYLNVKIHICRWRWRFIFIASTTFLMLVDGTRQAGPVGCSSIYQSTLQLRIIYSWAEYLGAYVYVLYFNWGDILSLPLWCYYICHQQVAIASWVWPNWAYFILQIVY